MTPRKLLDVSRLAVLGWKNRIDIESGLKKYYQNYAEGADSN